MKNGKVFLLGAGFSYAISEGKIPLTDGLMDKISDLIIPKLSQDYENTYPNIELFITLLDIKKYYLRNKALKERIEKIYKNIVERIVSLIDIDILKNDYPLCKEFVEKKVSREDAIITLNYDCLLDKYLWLSGRWSPNGGYGITFPFSGSQISQNEKLDNILLLKIHGSCNFRNNSGNENYPNIEIREEIFPEIHSQLCDRNTKLDKGPHILMMSYLKQPSNQLRQIWRRALEQIEKSNKLVIIGCSLREEDEFLKFALYHFGVKASDTHLKIEIVDKDEEEGKKIKLKLEKMCLLPYSQKQEFKVYKNLKSYIQEY